MRKCREKRVYSIYAVNAIVCDRVGKYTVEIKFIWTYKVDIQSTESTKSSSIVTNELSSFFSCEHYEYPYIAWK